MAAPAKRDMTVYPIQAAVRSESDGARAYTVTLPYCPCADFTNRRGMLIEVDEHTAGVTICKHIASAMARVGGWHRPEPEVWSDLTRSEVFQVLDDKAGLQGRAVTVALHNVNTGAPQQLPRPGLPAVILETHPSGTHRRYRVTIPG